jgi:hypothetical protein
VVLALALVVMLAAASTALAAGTVSLSTSQPDPVVGESVTYTADVSGGTPPFTYSFTIDGGSASPPGSSNTLTTSFSATGAHTVRVDVSDQDSEAPDFSDTKSVTVLSQLSGTIASSTDSAGPMEPVTFSVNDAAGGKAPLGITWDTDGDGFDDGMGSSISPSFTTPGVRTVRAQIVDNASPAHALVLSTSVTIVARTCLKQTAFALVEITTQGCLSNVGTSAAPRYESSDAVKVNGIPFPAPLGGTKFLAIAPIAADPGGRIGIAGTTIKLGGLTVFSGHIDWALPAGGKGDEKLLRTLTLPGGQKLFGLKVGGSIAVKLGIRADGTHYATFPLNIQLPDVFKTGPGQSAGGVSAAAAIRVEESGIKYDGLKLQVSNVYVGKLKVESVCFSFVPSGSQAVAPCPIPSLGGTPFLQCNENVNTDRWDGNAVLELPTQSKTRLALFGGVANERLSNLGGFVDNLGTFVPIVPGVFLTRVGVGLCVYPPPFKLKGDAGVSVLPTGGKSTIAVNGYFLYTDAFNGKPWSLEIGGSVSVLNRPLGSGKLIIRPTGSIDFSLQAKFSLLSVVDVDGKVMGWIETKSRKFNVDGTVRACIRSIRCADAEAVLSSTGVAGCLDVGAITYYVLVRNHNWKWYAPWRVHWEARHRKLKAGFGHRWSESKVSVWATSCNLGKYRAARGAQTGRGRAFAVAPGTPAIALNVIGRNGSPKVRLTGPGGAVITSPAGADSARGAGYMLVENPTESSTAILLINPKAGSWKVEALDGGDSVATLQIARFEPPPNFVGAVVKRPKGRVAVGVSYALPPGAQLDLLERGPAVEHLIASDVKGKPCPGPDRPGGQTLLCFRKIFAPAFGPGGRRQILAVVTRDGIPLSTTPIAGFTVPKPRLPSRPGRLRLERRDSTVAVAFDRSAGAASHTLSFSLSTGKRFGVQPSQLSCRAVLVRDIARSVKVSVRVAGVRRDLEVGPYAVATLPRKAKRAGNRAKLPKSTCATASGG